MSSELHSILYPNRGRTTKLSTDATAIQHTSHYNFIIQVCLRSIEEREILLWIL